MRNFKRFFRMLSVGIIMFYVTSPAFSQALTALDRSIMFKSAAPVPDNQARDARSLASMLNELETTYKIHFSYPTHLVNDRVIPETEKLAATKNLDEVLNHILSPLGLKYEKIEQDLYLIFEKKNNTPAKLENKLVPAVNDETSTLHLIEKVEKIGSNMLTSIQKTVSGQVTDENDEGLPGVNILIKNTPTGTVTDVEGNYRLNMPDDATTLVFSSVGYETQEVFVGNETTVNVKMSPDIQALSEIVVTALGIKREERSLGYSVGKVEGENLIKTNQGNLLNAMAGKVSGVKISQMNGTVGSTVNIVIRGATSLNNDNQPLFVIDGIPVKNQLDNSYQGADVGNAISDINPNDIESISVLKGASAAALYGSRAGNGVILINTRSGKGAGKGVGVTLNSSLTFDIPYDYFPVQNKFASGKAGAHIFEENENESWGAQLDVGEEWVQWNTNGEPAPLVSYPSRFKDFFETGTTLTNNVAIQGNHEFGNFRLSVGDMRNSGIIPNSDLKRNTINLNTTMNVSKKIMVTANLNWTNSRSDNRPNIEAGRDDVVRSLYETGSQVNINELKDYWVPGMEGVQQLKYKEKQNNVWFLVNENPNSFNRDRLTTKLQLDWQLNDDFTLIGRFTRDGYSEGREAKTAFSTYGEFNGGYNFMDLSHEETNFELNLSYKKDLGDKWSLHSFVAGNRMNSIGKSIMNDASQLTIPELYTISNGVPGTVTYNSQWSEKAIYSIYGMASLGFNGMVYLDVTARNDWSSTLPANNRSYFYPSASLSVLLSEMMPMPSWLTYTKIRGGIAQVGNDTNPYALNQVFSVAEDWGTAKQMYMSGTLKNNQLLPEMAISKEVGLDFKMFKNRIGVEASYYISQNENQVLGITLPVESGATSKLINTGLIESKGWELSLQTTPVLTEDLQFNLNFNLTTNKTVLKELADGLTDFTFESTDGAYFRTYVGGQIGDIWMNPMLLVEDESSPYYGYPLLTSNGRYQNDTDPEHLVKIGNANPDFVLGIQPSIQYKGFSLYANIDWNQGGEFYSRTRMFFGNNGWNEDTFSGAPYDPNQDISEQIKANPEAFFGEWVGGRTGEYGGFPWPDNDNRLNDASFNVGVREAVDENGDKTYVENLGGPDTYWLDPFTANRYASRPFPDKNLYSATYVKLREIALSYRIPASFTERLHIKNSSVSLIATNMLEWTKAGVNVDPERAYLPNNGKWVQGLEYYNAMPWTGSVGIKLSVEF